MALHDLARADLDQDPLRTVVEMLDDWSHIVSVAIREADGRLVRFIDRATARRLHDEKVILTAPNLTEQRAYIHYQSRLFALAQAGG